MRSRPIAALLLSAATTAAMLSFVPSAAQAAPTGSPAPVRMATPAPLTSARDDGLDARQALAQAQSTGEPVEIEAERTEYTTSWAYPDGTGRAEVSGTPVRIRDHAGDWTPVDYDLVAQADGSYAPAASPADVTISGGGSTLAGAVTLDDGSELATVWPTTLPAPEIDGATATYEITPTEDLVLTATVTGFTTRIVLSAAPTAPLDELTLGLKTQHLTLSDDGARIAATGVDGDASAGIGQLVAWDSTTDYAGDRIPVDLDADLTHTAHVAAARSYDLDLGLPTGW